MTAHDKTFLSLSRSEGTRRSEMPGYGQFYVIVEIHVHLISFAVCTLQTGVEEADRFRAAFADSCLASVTAEKL